ncbi:MAG: hypothetical protein NTZ95_01835 [Candidatus Omnitrophica bacterium]|nr:hypothetical protein [Candidatus Omnitrophota bacterium]
MKLEVRDQRSEIRRKILSSLLCLLISVFCLLSTAGCGPTYPKEKFKESIIRLCKKEYSLDVKVKTVGKTVAIYLPLTNLLDFTFALTTDAGEKINQVILNVTRVVLSTDAEYDFYCVMAHDVRIPEIQIVIIKSVEDVRRFLLGDISRGEYGKRMLIDMRIAPQAQKERAIKDVFDRMSIDKKWQEGVMQDFFMSDPATLGDIGYWAGKFYIKDINLPEFLAEEIASRIRLSFRDNKELNDSLILKSAKGIYAAGVQNGGSRYFKIEISAEPRTIEASTSKEASDKLFGYALKTSYDVIHGYNFKDFDYVEIRSLTDGRASKVLKEDLDNYKPKNTKIEDVMVFDSF